MQGAGITVGAGLLGATTADTAEAAVTEVPLEFANPRVLRATHAWERGYRGQPNRALGLTDSGTESRHPDLGPWNGVTVTTRNDGFELFQYRTDGSVDAEQIGESEAFSGFAAPIEQTETLEIPDDTDRIAFTLESDELTGIDEVDDEVDAAIEVELLEDGTTVAANRNEIGRTVEYDFVDDDAEYELGVFVADIPGSYDIEVSYFELDGDGLLGGEIDPYADVDDVPMLVGWHNDNTRFGYSRAPRDENSHGTHCASIMTGTGRGSAFDPERTTVDDANTVLLPGQTLSYEIEAAAGTGVFASAYGELIELAIEGPNGETLATSGATQGLPELADRNNTTETPTVHDGGEATYTVHVRAAEGEALPAQIDTVAAGAFKHFSETAGDATDANDRSMHAGMAPGFSLVSVTDLGTGTADLAAFAEQFASTFNLRAVNMSWGFVGGVPLGTVAGIGDDTVENVRKLAEAGVLSVAAAGNDAQPASGNGPPAVANEAISTVATGPLDGIAAYSSGGLAGIDDESFEPYTKPDVMAIGGAVTDLDMAAMPGDTDDDDPAADADNFGDVRIYAGKGGTSMAAPSACGAAGLVMQAMEEDGPVGLDLPSPAELIENFEPEERRAWVLKAKQALLATASTTAFNAAPFHRAKVPVYSHGERDPYEGFGRINVGAAVDAVSRDLLDDDAEFEVLGLDVPHDEQAAAGYLIADGDVEITADFSHYGGGNSGMTKADPHIDLFVYDALHPEGIDGDGPATGDPNIVESDQGIDGSASVSFDAGDGGLYYVVVKLVSVPGVVNGYDVQAHIELDIETEEAEEPPDDGDDDDEGEEDELVETADRDDDSSTNTGGQTGRAAFDVETTEDVILREFVPEGWDVLERFATDIDATTPAPSGGTFVYFSVDGDTDFDVAYLAEAPENVDDSGVYEFGPLAVTTDVGGDETLTDPSREWKEIDDTTHERVVVGTEVDVDEVEL